MNEMNNAEESSNEVSFEVSLQEKKQYHEEYHTPFTPKPKHLHLTPEKADVSHRSFKATVFPSQILNAFKKGVHKGEYTTDELLTVYSVVATELMRTDDDHVIIKAHNWIRDKVNIVYERRLKAKRKVR